MIFEHFEFRVKVPEKCLAKYFSQTGMIKVLTAKMSLLTNFENLKEAQIFSRARQ